MKTQLRTRRGHPAAFTLIELLVVIAILAVLFSLTSAAVMKFIDNGTRVQTRSDIGEFETTLRAAMGEMGSVEYVPSVLLLKEKYAAAPVGGNAQLEIDSKTYLIKLFGKNYNPTTTTCKWLVGQTLPANGVILQGPQLLVFLLGGVQDSTGGTPSCIGFSKTSNPAAPPTVAGEKRYGPYYTDFKPSRLKQEALTASTTPTGCYFYLDPYGSPYLFFSRGPNGTETYNEVTGIYGVSSCPTSLTDKASGTKYNIGTVTPYVSSTSKTSGTVYMNPKWCQIISAGKNKLYGPGGTNWSPTTGYANAPAAAQTNGGDDMSNFSTGPLIVGTK